ncbi:hypothetical protein [Treponema phagedenis]|uniref:Uncharacterized protein n=1 Tax=Treponema phagedenis TaxID=162 RepID=A0AAE6M771_TREPH|nr:hypothetical protein [Treponema phagedenis]NVP22929.1 hypothetical protein [Treponema phagedenis]QEJ98278.1 hypothetical protein FUT82_09885 [Treponema phagedenis]QEK03789.1 hypothetical protein FUT83_08195 [Treponema phagedenis]QEK09404.1 hypothetical protein FUT81_08110 [Treponema phagedenis]QLC57817.1 hypothetical protein HW453_02585 [Treponema phagedenis]
MNKSQTALRAVQEKYPQGIPPFHSLNDEQKAWLALQIQTISEAGYKSRTAKELRKIHRRLSSATEDIPDKDLEKMLSFIFANIKKIENMT